MRTYKLLTLSLLLSSATFAAACGGEESDTAPTASATMAMTMTTGGSTPTTGGTDGTTDGTTDPTTDPTADPTTDPTNPPTTTEDPTTGGADPFVFDETPPEDLAQVDRMGMPAVATALISSGMKDAYNEATPLVDAEATFVDDIVANLTGLHAALDDDLMGFGLTPCAIDVCAKQGAPLVVPDVLAIDINAPSGFPNGRRLADPVIDVTLAVIMLDLTVHDALTFANIPLNPPANDKEFLPDFPYVATPF